MQFNYVWTNKQIHWLLFDIPNDGNVDHYKCREAGTSIYIYRRREQRPCLEIIIDATTESAHLCRHYKSPDLCPDLLRTIQRILEQRTDVSCLIFQDLSRKSDAEFVATGKTWYGNLMPLEIVDDNFFDTQFFEQNYKNITTAKWVDVIARMESYNECTITIPVDIADIDPQLPGSAMHVFRRIKDVNPDFFTDYRTCCTVAVPCNSFYGSFWRYRWSQPKTFQATTPGTEAAPTH